MARRSKASAWILGLGLSLAGLAGCASDPEPTPDADAQEGERPRASDDPQPDTQNPEAPPLGSPREKIRPQDVETED